MIRFDVFHRINPIRIHPILEFRSFPISELQRVPAKCRQIAIQSAVGSNSEWREIEMGQVVDATREM